MNWYGRIIIKTADWGKFMGSWDEVAAQLRAKLKREPHPTEVEKALLERFMNFDTPEEEKW